LLYVTCSTDAREDEQIVNQFLAANTGWRSSALALKAPPDSILQLGDYALTLPGIDGADGFFFAKLERR
jgi:16S rRNA C967 or C1407 C5-methylase (RsmB/RsmF family)